jgi:hypothetical protein
MRAQAITRNQRFSPGMIMLVGAMLMAATFAVDAMTGLNPAGAAAAEAAQAEAAE